MALQDDSSKNIGTQKEKSQMVCYTASGESLEKIDKVSKMAAVKASASLSKLMKNPVGLEMSPAAVVKDHELPNGMKPDDLMVGITAPLSGGLKGMSLLLYRKEPALLLCDMLLQRKPNETNSFLEIEISALTEVANIIVGNYLTQFSKPLNLSAVMHHVPSFKCDTYAKMVEHVTEDVGKTIDDGIWLEIIIAMQQHRIKGYLMFMLDLDAMNKVFSK